MMIKRFILYDKNITRDSYIWNLFASIIQAFQSVIMLILITHLSGLEDAGIFTIAYANANLFLNVGKYGMRYYQVSDVRGDFSFAEYRRSRVITTAAMIGTSCIYIVYAAFMNAYSTEKSLIMLCQCLLMSVSAIEDVYHGLYQNKGRLDVAAKAAFLRTILALTCFIISFAVCRNLLYASAAATALSFALYIVFTKWTYPLFEEKNAVFSKEKVCVLLRQCFPLFCGAFLSIYIGNVPKYAIDAQLSDEVQACYGFIAMPVFVVGLLNNFIFMPSLRKLSVLWNEGNINDFIVSVLKYVGFIAGVTIVCILGAHLVGIPVLSFLYNTPLEPYKTDLLILLVGGGFLGLAGFLNAIITVVRFQNSIIWGYATAAVISSILADGAVIRWGIRGASVLYVMIMACVSLLFSIFLLYGALIRPKRNKFGDANSR